MSNTTTTVRSTRKRRGLGIAVGLVALVTPLAMAPGASAYSGVGGLVGQVVAGSAGPDCNINEGGGPPQGLELGATLSGVLDLILPDKCGPSPQYTNGATLDKPTPPAAKATTSKKAKKATKKKKKHSKKKSKKKTKAHAHHH